MLQHRRYCRALLREMKSRGFSETDMVRKLYKAA
jgi:hypothetical protein